jgi:hypothetical protein
MISSKALANDEMQLTSDGPNGGSKLISVLDRNTGPR